MTKNTEAIGTKRLFTLSLREHWRDRMRCDLIWWSWRLAWTYQRLPKVIDMDPWFLLRSEFLAYYYDSFMEKKETTMWCPQLTVFNGPMPLGLEKVSFPNISFYVFSVLFIPMLQKLLSQTSIRIISEIFHIDSRSMSIITLQVSPAHFQILVDDNLSCHCL